MDAIAEHPFIKQRREGEVDPIYSLKQAALIAGECPHTLRNRGKAGKLKVLKLSARRCGIRASELNRYLSEKETL